MAANTAAIFAVFGAVEADVLEHRHALGAGAVAQGAGQRLALDLALHLVAVVARMRAEGHAAADAGRAAGVAGAGPAGALLLVELLLREVDLGTGLGVVRSLALVGQVVAHHLVQGLLMNGLREQRGRGVPRSPSACRRRQRVLPLPCAYLVRFSCPVRRSRSATNGWAG